MPSIEVILATVTSCGCGVDISGPGTIPRARLSQTAAHSRVVCMKKTAGHDVPEINGTLDLLPLRQADLTGRQMNRQHLWGQRTLANSGKPKKFLAWKKGEL